MLLNNHYETPLLWDESVSVEAGATLSDLTQGNEYLEVVYGGNYNEFK
ncbi:MAG: hypothetical protein MR690_08665 [Rikenellaceae bacterium]|nr:hypothetical protein [Rikenellaceae bacterium]